MTYPPQPEQPNYGQQPGPYGQQPGGYGQALGGYPQSGGFPQPGQQPYGQPYPGAGGGDGYPPPGQFGQYGGYGAPPPGGGGSKKGLWIGLSIGLVVILAALGITGFWLPGFFLSKSGGPDATAQAIVTALNKHDKAALNALKCAQADPSVSDAIDGVDEVKTATLTGPLTKVSDTSYTGTIRATGTGATADFTGTLANEGGKWCWQKLALAGSGNSPASPASPTGSDSSPESSSSPGAGSSSGGLYRTTVQNFLDKINSADSSGAMALVCQGSAADIQSSVSKAAVSGTQLNIENLSGSKGFSIGSLTGAVGGTTITVGSIGSDDAPGGGSCIDLFTVY